MPGDWKDPVQGQRMEDQENKDNKCFTHLIKNRFRYFALVLIFSIIFYSGYLWVLLFCGKNYPCPFFNFFRVIERIFWGISVWIFDIWIDKSLAHFQTKKHTRILRFN